MKNSDTIVVSFAMPLGNVQCTTCALVKQTEHPQKFHVLRVQPTNYWENASVINDFYITKTVQNSVPVWVHADTDTSSNIVQAIGEALDKMNAA